MTLIYTELFHDDFQRPDEAPIDPAHWTMSGSLPGNDVIQIVSHIACTTVQVQGDGQGVYLPALPNDQYLEVIIDTLAPIPADDSYEPVLLAYLRTTPNFSGGLWAPDAYVIEIFNPDGGGGEVGFFQIVNGSTIVYGPPTVPCPMWVQGDKLTYAVIGNYATGSLYAFKNGVLILQTPLGAAPAINFLAGGISGLQLSQTPTGGGLPPQTIDTSISRWAVGSVAIGPTPPAYYSVPDDRVPPEGPNASRNVENTLIYDVQVSGNSAVPAVDSRVSKPVDSRASTPTNSRTPGTYGPGE